MRIQYSLLISFILLLVSCSDKEADQPSYIYLDKIDLETKDFEGTASSAFTDAWFTIGGQLIGGFQLPCTIPVMNHGKQGIQIKAGVKLNGSSGSRVTYTPLNNCNIFDLDNNAIDSITLTPGEVTTFKATATYRDNITFMLNDRFEGAGEDIQSEELTKLEDTVEVVYTSILERTDDVIEVFEGKSSGVVHLTKEKHTVLITTPKKEFKVPGLNGFNYIELNYKTEVPLRFGLWFNDPSATQVERHTVRESDGEWKKIYLHIRPEEAYDYNSDVFGATKYKPYILAKLPESMDEAFLYLDNFKLIHEDE